MGWKLNWHWQVNVKPAEVPSMKFKVWKEETEAEQNLKNRVFRLKLISQKQQEETRLAPTAPALVKAGIPLWCQFRDAALTSGTVEKSHRPEAKVQCLPQARETPFCFPSQNTCSYKISAWWLPRERRMGSYFLIGAELRSFTWGCGQKKNMFPAIPVNNKWCQLDCTPWGGVQVGKK